MIFFGIYPNLFLIFFIFLISKHFYFPSNYIKKVTKTSCHYGWFQKYIECVFLFLFSLPSFRFPGLRRARVQLRLQVRHNFVAHRCIIISKRTCHRISTITSHQDKRSFFKKRNTDLLFETKVLFLSQVNLETRCLPDPFFSIRHTEEKLWKEFAGKDIFCFLENAKVRKVSKVFFTEKVGNEH